MPVQSNADGNVPFTGPRARYNILGSSPTWVYHRMGPAVALTGVPPRSASVGVADFDPVVTGGRAEFASLSEGGLFTLLAHYKRAMVVEAVDLSAGVTASIVDSTGADLRPFPSTLPARLAPGECLKATGGATGGRAGFLVRAAGEQNW